MKPIVVMPDKLVVCNLLSCWRISNIEFYRATRFPCADTNENRHARENRRRRGKERHDDGVILTANIAPVSECARNRADCNSVGMNEIKKKGGKIDGVLLPPSGINLALLSSAIRGYATCTLHTITPLLGHHSGEIAHHRFARAPRQIDSD